MQLSCHGCSLPVLATVFLSSKKADKSKFSPSRYMGKKTDLGPKEEHRLISKGAISSSEIAELYLYLDNSKIDFTKIDK